MTQLGNAIATLILGGLLIAWLVIFAWQLMKGVGSTPVAGKFTRAQDPFSFWLSMLVQGAFLAFLLIAGAAALLGAR